MNCRDAGQLLPLWVGRDLPDVNESKELEQHLSECSQCRERLHSLQQSLDALQSISTAAVEVGSVISGRSSLWPEISRRLPDRNPVRERFNGWIPATAMALAVLIMVSVSITTVQRELGSSGSLSWQWSPSSQAINRNLFQSDVRFSSDAPAFRSDVPFVRSDDRPQSILLPAKNKLRNHQRQEW